MQDVTDTLELALAASGCDQAHVRHKSRLLSDNGPSYIAGELAEWIGAQGMSHARGAPFHPQTQGKIERWHQALKNRVLLEKICTNFDFDRKMALETRTKFINDHADKNVVIFGTHFNTPSAGRIVRDKDTWCFVPLN